MCSNSRVNIIIKEGATKGKMKNKTLSLHGKKKKSDYILGRHIFDQLSLYFLRGKKFVHVRKFCFVSFKEIFCMVNYIDLVKIQIKLTIYSQSLKNGDPRWLYLWIASAESRVTTILVKKM